MNSIDVLTCATFTFGKNKRLQQKCKSDGREFPWNNTPINYSDPERVIISSAGRGWTDIAGVIKKDVPQVRSRNLSSSLWITYPLATADTIKMIETVRSGFRRKDRQLHSNGPLNYLQKTMCEGNSTFHLFLNTAVLNEVAYKHFGRSAFALDWNCGVLATVEALHFVQAAFQMLLDPEDTAWRSGYLARTIAAYLIDRHADLKDEAETQELSPQQLSYVSDFMEKNIENRFKYCMLAASLGLSRTAFFQRFSYTVKLTPHQYMQSIRLVKAKNLIQTQNFPLSEIAVICGFTDQSHMSRLFRKHIGLSPNQFRTQVG